MLVVLVSVLYCQRDGAIPLIKFTGTRAKSKPYGPEISPYAIERSGNPDHAMIVHF